MSRPKDPRAKGELLTAAAQVFVEKGLDQARVEDITARAGRSKGSFYLHFETKEDAFTQIVEDMTARLAAALESPPEQPVQSPGELVARVHERLTHDVATFEFLWQNREVVRLVLSGAGSTRFRHLIDGFAHTAAQQIRLWLLWGQHNGLYRNDLDVELASISAAGAYDRVARHMLTLTQRPDIARWLKEVQDIFLLGMATPQGAQLLGGTAPLADRVRKPRVRPS